MQMKEALSYYNLRLIEYVQEYGSYAVEPSNSHYIVRPGIW